MDIVYALLPTGLAYARGVLRGVRDAGAETHRFSVRFTAAESISRWWAEVDREGVRGLIVFASDTKTCEAALAMPIPVVNVSARLDAPPLPSVLPDNRAVGRLAAEHLLDRGFRRQVYVGHGGLAFSQERCAGWAAAVEAAGGVATAMENERGEGGTIDRLRALDKPVGVVCCHDGLARELVDRAIEAGMAVPDQLAMVGVDDAEDICEAGAVAISSVPINGEGVGRAAYGLLERLIDGHPAPEQPTHIPPCRVTARRSTETIAEADPQTLKAIRYIQQHALHGIDVAHVARETEVSRATLYERFPRVLGRTPHEEIRRIQLAEARRLLTDTNHRIGEIARQCGFNEPNYFMRVFRQATGQTPTQYRRAHSHG